MTDREAAWDAAHEAHPAGWTVGPDVRSRRPQLVRHGAIHRLQPSQTAKYRPSRRVSC